MLFRHLWRRMRSASIYVQAQTIVILLFINNIIRVTADRQYRTCNKQHLLVIVFGHLLQWWFNTKMNKKQWSDEMKVAIITICLANRSLRLSILLFQRPSDAPQNWYRTFRLRFSEIEQTNPCRSPPTCLKRRLYSWIRYILIC